MEKRKGKNIHRYTYIKRVQKTYNKTNPKKTKESNISKCSYVTLGQVTWDVSFSTGFPNGC